MRHENLCLMLQAAEGGRMDDAVAVALERRAGRAFRFRVETAARLRRIAGIGRARPEAEADADAAKLVRHGPKPPVDLPLSASYLWWVRESKVTPMGADAKTAMKGVDLSEAAAKRIARIVAAE